MFVTFDRAMLLTLFVVVLSTTSTLVRSQAPNDAHPSCTMQSVSEDVVMLLDSAWYRSLLPSNVYESAGWTPVPAGSWKGSGNLCFRTVKSCDDDSENSLVTQYINKTADVTYALKITVDLQGDATGSDPIRVYYYPSDGPVASGAQLDPINYNHIGNVSFGVRSSRKVVTFFLDSQFDRFYLGIVEADSCFTLRRLRVWYSLCPAETDGLVVYPETPVGDSAVDASASCKPNAAVSPDSSLSITCNTDGTYSGSPDCSCRGGHVESGDSCHACATGTYALPGATLCQPCPENSHSERAAPFCPCSENYVRSDPSDVTLPCKSAPTTAPPTTAPPTTTPTVTTVPVTTPTTEPPPTLEVIGPFIAWSLPAQHDGEILHYEVKITSVTGAYVIVQKTKMDFYHMLEKENVPSDLGRSPFIGIQVRAVTTEGFGDWSAEEFIPVAVLVITDVIPHLLDPEPKISLINDSPVVSGKDIEIHLATNHPVSSLECRLDSADSIHLGDDEDYQDCSSGMITYTNLPTAQLTFYAVAKVQSNGQVITLKRSFRPENDFECSVHLINDGLTIDGDDAVVNYAFTGNHTRCSLDGGDFYDCSSPLEMPNLSSGKHSIKITPLPCLPPWRHPLKIDFDIR